MPDITMCLNEKCEKKEACYRWTAVPSTRQSYTRFGAQGPCEHFMPIYEKNKAFVD